MNTRVPLFVLFLGEKVMMVRLVLNFGLLFSFVVLGAQSNDGWTMVGDNRFTEAKKLFEKQFAEGDRSEPTLCGLLFLAETTRDYDPYCRYAAELVKHTQQAPYAWLFGHLNPEAVPPTLPESLILTQRIRKADSLFYHKQFEASNKINRSIVPDWTWCVTGPFLNVAGSGFVENAEPETRPFLPSDTFRTSTGINVGWLPLEFTKPGAQVDFSRLPQTGGHAVYFAHTFIESEIHQTVALNVTRSEPMQIWLDGYLIAQMHQPGAVADWDAETLYFELEKGTHSLMVKVAEFPFEPEESRLQLGFHEQENEGDDWLQTDRKLRDPQTSLESMLFDRFSPGTGFVLRLCDPQTGRLLTNIQPGVAQNYHAGAKPPTQVVFKENPYLAHFVRLEKAQPEALWRQYLRIKAYTRSSAPEDGEAWMLQKQRENSSSDFHRYLLAKCYDLNGKPERAESLLSAMDSSTAPTFAERYVRLLKLDKDQDEAAYQSALMDLLTLSPENGLVLDRYLKFLQEKGRNEEAGSYVRNFLSNTNDPKWKDRLSEYLEATSYKPSSHKPPSDQDRERLYRKARRALKKTFDPNDYMTVLQFQKRNGQQRDVLATFDDMLVSAPWMRLFFYEKASYLFENERTDEALALIGTLLKTEPFNPDLYELQGDIFFEKKNEKAALDAYLFAEKLLGISAYGLREKIDKIAEKTSYNAFFSPVNTDAAARDRSWLEAYPGAESVIALYNQQSTYYPEERRLESRRRVVIHILSDAGAKRWTEADLRQLGNISNARVLKKDGSVTSPDLGWGMAVFKNLQAGDVIIAEGQSDSNMPDEMMGEFLDINLVSWQAPVVQAEFELLLPDSMALHAACNKVDCNYTTRDSASLRLYRWSWQKVPKMEEEVGTPVNLDGVAWLMLGNAPDWGHVVQWYERTTYCRSEPNYEVLEKVRELIRPDMSEAAIVQTLHHFITSEISYSYVPFLNSNYVPKKPGETLSGKIGDCKDVATLMISLLREHGIPAWYTLVSTHNFTNREPRPTIYVFNHAIVAYQLSDGVLRFADLTTDYFPTGVLPGNDCDAWALVIRPGETQLRRLPDHALDPEVSSFIIHASARLDEEHNVLINSSISCKGTVAGNWREELLRSTEEEKHRRLTEYFGGGVLSHLDLLSFRFEGLDSFDAPLTLKMEATAYHQLDRVSNLWIMPLPLPMSLPVQKALFASQRYNDIDLDAFFELAPIFETVDFEVPQGFELVEIPQNLILHTRFGDYELTFEPTATGLRLKRSLVFKQRFLLDTDFPEFKKFYLAVLDGDDVRLAMKKVDSRQSTVNSPKPTVKSPNSEVSSQ
ncbi:MAG: hypothetical protein IT270_01480 [Saprospiraceae bacterium]|nr:hypothetical protein [Saprospiraceae bacterium]